jgi:hypothetical protein
MERSTRNISGKKGSTVSAIIHVEFHDRHKERDIIWKYISLEFSRNIRK